MFGRPNMSRVVKTLLKIKEFKIINCVGALKLQF